MLGQGIGAPSSATVKVGDTVNAGDALGVFTPDKLGTSVHSPINGKVTEVTDRYVAVKA